MKEKPEYPEVYKVIGAPGTGKTTRVVGNDNIENHTSLVQRNLEEYDLRDQMIVTYTKAGTEEAADRLYKLLDSTKKLINNRVTTIHSQCFRKLGLSRDEVANHYDKRQFCDTQDLEYGWDNDDDDLMSADKQPGNALMDIYGWLKSNRKELDEWEDCPAGWSGDRNPAELMRRWEEYKADHNLYDFSDMIEQNVEMAREQVQNLGWGFLFNDEDKSDREVFERARMNSKRDPSIARGVGAFVDTKVLYVDEVQDLTPLQWDWYLAQKLVCEKVYIGGDDDQTIYGWAGANPEFMLNEEGDFEVLETTYRIPEKIWDECDGVINQVDVRQDKDVTPAGEGGEVVKLQRPSARQVVEEVQDGSVFMLFRARYMIDEFTDNLHSLGIPYDNMSTYDTWDKDTVIVRDALAKIENGKDDLTGEEVKKLKELMEDQYVKKNSSQDTVDDILNSIGGNKVDEVSSAFNFPSYGGVSSLNMHTYLEYCEELNYYQKEAIRGNIAAGNEDMYPDRVKLGTIHSSKGKEAETVVLFLDSTQTIVENMIEDTKDKPQKNISDAERRLYYVGMTRASKKLVLCEGGVNPECTILLSELLEDYEGAERYAQSRVRSTGGWH